MCPVRGTTNTIVRIIAFTHISIYVPRAGHNISIFKIPIYRNIISIYVPRAGHNANATPAVAKVHISIYVPRAGHNCSS